MGYLVELATNARVSPDGATVSLPDPQEKELRRLVNQVADAHDFSPQDRAEALDVALRDPDRIRALTCFRAMSAECSDTVH
jgi:hypothetical protein